MADTIQIGLDVIIIGFIAGIVASLWNILPFFIAGIQNTLLITVGTAIILLLALSRLKKDIVFKSGVLAVIVFLISSFAIVPIVSGLIFNDSAVISEPAEGLETLDLELPGLFCQGCAYSAQNALKGVDGVADAKVSFEAKKGTVVYDPNKVSPEQILANDLIKAYGGRIK